VRRWFREGIDDGETFRRRVKCMLVVQWLAELGVVAAILLTR
jgi:hypothetical protein